MEVYRTCFHDSWRSADERGRSALSSRCSDSRRPVKNWRRAVDGWYLFFFQAEDGIRDYKVTGVQTCALPISAGGETARMPPSKASSAPSGCEAPRTEDAPSEIPKAPTLVAPSRFSSRATASR